MYACVRAGRVFVGAHVLDGPHRCVFNLEIEIFYLIDQEIEVLLFAATVRHAADG
jgi:hypothetical protein